MEIKYKEVHGTLQKMLQLIEVVAESKKISSNDLLGLDRDKDFVVSAIKELESNDYERINALWTKVQSMSRFFGCDCLRYSMTKELEEFSDLLFDGMLELISEIRKK
jgi:hypothetical protein